MTRTGKIARLPLSIREQINRRLQDGGPGKQIVAWLKSLPEAQAVMAAQFKGRPINETNVSHWKHGGYQDWQAAQAAMEAVGRFGGDLAELNQLAGGHLTDQLAVCVAARIAVTLRESTEGEDDPATQLRRLRQLCANLVALRKGDHETQRMQIERGKMDLASNKPSRGGKAGGCHAGE